MDTRRATKGPAGILDRMSRSPRKRNKSDAPGSAAAVEVRCEVRVNPAGKLPVISIPSSAILFPLEKKTRGKL